MEKVQIGVIGLGVMGANLARNFASRKIGTAVFNRTYQRTEEFLKTYANPENGLLVGFEKLEDFVAALEMPRRIILMVKAGIAVDEVIADLKPLLVPGDVIIDGGNSFFMDTVRRSQELEKVDLNFVGMGISGGEEGALLGPSIMPGGSDEAWISLQPLLEKIAARDFEGGPCVTHVGRDGAGHYVKMVHNGIEYAMMQLIAEIYDYNRKIEGRSAGEIAEIFEKIQSSPAQSFLSEITIPVLKHMDKETGDFLVNKILDRAAQKGTGGWMASEGLRIGAPISAISEAVFARSLSSFKSDRTKLANLYGFKKDRTRNMSDRSGTSADSIIVARREASASHLVFEKVMLFGMIIAYAQGIHLISQAAKEYKWTVDLAEICRIWQGGCIIRSELLRTLREAFGGQPNLEIILEDRIIIGLLNDSKEEFRNFLLAGISGTMAMPVSAAMLSYFDGITASDSPANLIQGLRDFFGAHTFERTDKSGIFHETWI